MKNNSSRTTTTTKSLKRQTVVPALLLLLAGCFAGGHGENRVKIAIKLEMPATSFLVEQTTPVRLTIDNQNASAVNIPDPLLNDVTPEYIITDPRGKQTTVTHADTKTKVLGLHDPEAPPSREMMSLGPKAKWSELIPLDPMLPLAEPGLYRVQVAYTIGQDRMLSPAVEFSIAPANVTAFAVVPQGPDRLGARLSTAWAHASGSGVTLAEAVRLGKMWGKDQGGKLYSSPVYRGPSRPVTQIAVPAMHINRGMDFRDWVVWEQEGKVLAQRTDAGEPKGAPEVLYTAAVGAIRLIDSPVMDTQANLSVFLLEGENAKPQLVRLDLARNAGSQTRVRYRVAISAPIAVQAVHFQEAGQDRSLILFLSADTSGTTIAALPHSASPQLVSVAHLQDQQPIAGSPMGLYIDESGHTQIEVALQRSGKAAIGTAQMRIRSSGAVENAPVFRDIDLPGNSSLVWGFIATGADGAHLLWRDGHGRLIYQSDRTGAVEVAPAFKVTPSPALLVGDKSVFVAGVRDTGAFGIERLTTANTRRIQPE